MCPKGPVYCVIYSLKYYDRSRMLFLMSRRAPLVILSPEERATLHSWAKARSQPQRLAQRAQVVRWLLRGLKIRRSRRACAFRDTTVQLWRQRFLALRAAGLEKDAPRPGRIPRITSSQSRPSWKPRCTGKPPNATHWSTRTMAKAQGVSEATVRRIWQRHNLKPYRLNTFKLSRDPKFVDKLVDIVGLYLNPPGNPCAYAWTRKVRSKPWIAPSPVCQ